MLIRLLRDERGQGIVGDCSFHETTIDGLPYFIVATPYER